MVERAAKLFDEVVVAPTRNPQKAEALFSVEERRAMIEEATAHLAGVRTVALTGLTVDIAREVGAVALVKGLRAVTDFESEMQMAQMNHRLSGIDTLFIPTSPAQSFLAARLLREVARFGGDVSDLVPGAVATRLKAKFPR